MKSILIDPNIVIPTLTLPSPPLRIFLVQPVLSFKT